MVSGLGTSEESKLHSATQVFFHAAPSPSSRRSLSVEPGLYQGFNDPPLPSPVYVAGDTSQRGRMRVRRRSSADNLVFQRDPVAHLNHPPAPSPLSFPPRSEEEVIAHTPTSAYFVESPSSPISSIEMSTSARELQPPSTPTILLNPFP